MGGCMDGFRDCKQYVYFHSDTAYSRSSGDEHIHVRYPICSVLTRPAVHASYPRPPRVITSTPKWKFICHPSRRRSDLMIACFEQRAARDYGHRGGGGRVSCVSWCGRYAGRDGTERRDTGRDRGHAAPSHAVWTCRTGRDGLIGWARCPHWNKHWKRDWHALFYL